MTVVVWQTTLSGKRYDVTAVVSIHNGRGVVADVIAYGADCGKTLRLDPFEIEGLSQKTGLAVIRDRMFQRLADRIAQPPSFRPS